MCNGILAGLMVIGIVLFIFQPWRKDHGGTDKDYWG